MKRALWSCGVYLLGLSACLYGDDVVSSDACDGVRVDLCQATVRKCSTLDDLFPFAYNDEPSGWPAGGGGAPSVVRITAVAAADPADISTWVSAKLTTLEPKTGEGVETWRPTVRNCYKAELVVGGEVCETGYLDLSEVEALLGRTSIKNATIVIPPSAAYTGRPVQLKGVSVTLDGKTLVEGEDFAVVCRNNVKLGTATVLVSGSGDYEGTVESTFEIVSAPDVTASCSVREGVKADLRQGEPRVVLTLDQLFPIAVNSVPGDWPPGGATDKSSVVRVWKMAGADASDVSTWSRMESVSLDDVFGEDTVSWVPDWQCYYQLEMLVDGVSVLTNNLDLSNTSGLPGPESLEGVTITLQAPTAPYTGRPVTLEGIVVTMNGVTLREGVDYAVTYADNVLLGTATVTVSGAGMYKGTASATFEIVAAPDREVVRGEAKGANLDLRTNEVFVCSLSRDPVFTWNTSENFTTNPPAASVWRIGGLPEEANAVATISLDPMASRTAEPDATHRIMFCAQSGEGAKRVRDVAPGYYLARLTVTLDGEPVPGELTRIVRMTGGLVIFLK